MSPALDAVEFEDVPHVDTGSGLPYAVKRGTLQMFGQLIRVFILNDGRLIVDADDVRALLAHVAAPHTLH